MGHLSRLLAVARRLPNSVEVVFLTMSQALPVIQQFGFHAEYVPSHQHTLSDMATWNSWLKNTLDQVLKAYSIRAVVFDGNVVYPGISDAVLPRPDCPLIWIRRGMWQRDQDNSQSLLSGEDVDLIIEPGEVASDFDSGASADHREGVVFVDPIRLLDPDEVLPRNESCRTLGLDPNECNVLIQLGAGNNYNIIDLIGSAIETLEKTTIARPVIAEWLTSDIGLDLWPRIPRLRCFPISRYYRAFNFTISAAGYNSFNEIIGFGVPSLLAPNLNRAMDDQSARAAFADLHGAAVQLDHEMLPILDQVIDAMMDQGRLQAMKGKCQLIAKPNGAERAAQFVTDTIAQVESQ
jgi:hypothetical protein